MPEDELAAALAADELHSRHAANRPIRMGSPWVAGPCQLPRALEDLRPRGLEEERRPRVPDRPAADRYGLATRGRLPRVVLPRRGRVLARWGEASGEASAAEASEAGAAARHLARSPLKRHVAVPVIRSRAHARRRPALASAKPPIWSPSRAAQPARISHKRLRSAGSRGDRGLSLDRVTCRARRARS
jgi:hypothetical protein